MAGDLDRRRFFQEGGAAAAGLTLAVPRWLEGRRAPDKPVRLGFIGVGGRGTSLLRNSLAVADVQVPAVCDIRAAHAERAAGIVTSRGGPRPTLYTSGDFAYREMLQRDDLDAVLVATPWRWHTPMAVEAMERALSCYVKAERVS